MIITTKKKSSSEWNIKNKHKLKIEREQTLDKSVVTKAVKQLKTEKWSCSRRIHSELLKNRTKKFIASLIYICWKHPADWKTTLMPLIYRIGNKLILQTEYSISLTWKFRAIHQTHWLKPKRRNIGSFPSAVP